ncbi:hypothetical protein EVAR_98292_1 [Eumeta japonica]|uniref:Uncharacterized protein n=1 Tax=Eumeta variegata TaxID=151549 RepID=A0A4C1X9E6_EUMVA|nr:hypothetical protein EVAR_98292_1 [Eumeta japonica]
MCTNCLISVTVCLNSDHNQNKPPPNSPQTLVSRCRRCPKISLKEDSYEINLNYKKYGRPASSGRAKGATEEMSNRTLNGLARGGRETGPPGSPGYGRAGPRLPRVNP